MTLPKDPVMLLSVVNTALRDHYPSLDALCEDNGFDKEDITKKIACINYEYDASVNQFK